MNRREWVIDTNVLVSAALTPGGICDQILQHVVSGEIILIWNNPMLQEYRVVLTRPKFVLPGEIVEHLISALPLKGYRPYHPQSLNLPDPDDLPFIAAALCTDLPMIVSGNPRHIPKAILDRLGVTVLSPREGLDMLLNS